MKNFFKALATAFSWFWLYSLAVAFICDDRPMLLGSLPFALVGIAWIWRKELGA